MQKSALARFLIVCLSCLLIIFQNMKTVFSPIDITAQKNDNPLVFFDDTIGEQKPETVQEQPKTENPVTNTKTAVETLTGAVKGKIISKYISPYSAGSSYDKVYMKNSTGQAVDIKGLLSANLPYKIEKNAGVQVLIMHTHTTETFMPIDSEFYTETFTSRTTDNSKNMVMVGDIITKKLNDAGIKTLHDTTHHDYPQYNGSYTRSAATVNSYLKKHPEIKVVLDLHRDAVSSGDSDKVKLVTEIGGKKAAQVMLVMGSNTGTVKNYPHWQENLKLALRLQQEIEKSYPTLARPLSLVSKNYNQSLTKGSLLLEFGTDANSIDEVKYSAEMVGNALVTLLSSIG